MALHLKSRRVPLRWAPGALALMTAAGLAQAQDSAPGWEVSGVVRTTLQQRDASSVGPVAAANALAPGTVPVALRTQTAEAEVQLSGQGLQARVTAQSLRGDPGLPVQRSWVNELFYQSSGSTGWQWSVGKKIVSWDVGYGFRPNDTVQAEQRMPLVPVTLEGRPMVLAERFDEQRAWSIVAVQPTQRVSARGAQERSLAVRVYQRDGSTDWYGFARAGVRTGGSLGAAVSTVASEALELHASWRWASHLDSGANAVTGSALVRANPWADADVARSQPWLIGGTWTQDNQMSWMAEYWADPSAPSAAAWSAWGARNTALNALPALGVPASAVAGNLAWQTNTFGTSSNLAQRNGMVRWSWTLDAWQPSLTWLYHPADRGQLWTAALQWQGDRVLVQGGARWSAGPHGSVLMQLPTRQTVYLAASWAF